MATDPSITELARHHREHVMQAAVLRAMAASLSTPRVPPSDQPKKPETWWERLERESDGD